MRIDINEQAWNRGFWDGDSGKPSLACPYGVESDERLSWASGYIEGKAFRNGYIATPPGSRVPLRKSALAAELCAVPLRSTAQSSAVQDPRQRGVKIARRLGVNFRRRLTARSPSDWRGPGAWRWRPHRRRPRSGPRRACAGAHGNSQGRSSDLQASCQRGVSRLGGIGAPSGSRGKQ